jgi:predicted nucleic acid-binding protein
MQLIADANVWYDIASGRVDPQQFAVSRDDLFATPTSLLEIASGINERSFDERRRAAQSVLDHAAGVTEDTETHLGRIWGVPVQSATVSWMDGFRAIASAASPTELESGVADFSARVVRKVGVNLAHEWRQFHWRGFEQDVVKALDDWIPGYQQARNDGKLKRIAKTDRDLFKEAMRSRDIRVMLTLATYERVRLADSQLPDPSNESTAEAEATLANYINAYVEYIIRCATEMAPQPNDFGDSESFLYLQPGKALVTSDDRWIKIGQVVCPAQIVVPVLK